MGKSLTMTWKEYSALDLGDKCDLLNNHKKFLGDSLDQTLSQTTWAIFAGQELQPRLTGDELRNYPEEQDLLDLGRALDKPIFAYSRTHMDLF